MKGGIWDYVKAAFNARPLGMFVPPNWIGIGAFALLGWLNPGFWVIGAAVELAYLYFVSSNKRFQRVVKGKYLLEDRKGWQAKLASLLADLPAEDQKRYRNLETRCATILDREGDQVAAADAELLSEGLGKLTWIFLRLLITRQGLLQVLRGSSSIDADPLEKRLDRLQKQVKQDSLNDDLRKSLAGQAEILQQRIEKRHEATQKLAFLEAELNRIEEQAELIREQAVVSSDPNALSNRIDQVSASLGGTSQWIRDQQQIYGQVEDILTEAPPLMVQTNRQRETQ